MLCFLFGTITMGGAAPSSFKTVVLNSGCSASCFEFMPDLEASPECATANALLSQAMHEVTWADVGRDAEIVLPTNQALLVNVRARLALLETAGHAYPLQALPFMDLSGDKNKGSGRVNPFVSMLLPVGGVPLVEAICQGTCVAATFHGLVKAMHVDAATDQTIVDLLVYDLMCASAVFRGIPAYRTLFQHSAFCVDGKLKTETARYADVVDNLALGAEETAIIVLAEAPSIDVVDKLFPALCSWTEWTSVDPLNPLAIRGMGAVEFGGNCTDHGFRELVSDLTPAGSGPRTWVDRLVAVRMCIGPPPRSKCYRDCGALEALAKLAPIHCVHHRASAPRRLSAPR